MCGRVILLSGVWGRRMQDYGLVCRVWVTVLKHHFCAPVTCSTSRFCCPHGPHRPHNTHRNILMFVRARRLSYISHAHIAKHFEQLTGTVLQAASSPCIGPAAPTYLVCKYKFMVAWLSMLCNSWYKHFCGCCWLQLATRLQLIGLIQPQARRSATACMLQQDVLDRHRPRWHERWRVIDALAVSGKRSAAEHPSCNGHTHHMDRPDARIQRRHAVVVMSL